jgi:hypothetical protein
MVQHDSPISFGQDSTVHQVKPGAWFPTNQPLSLSFMKKHLFLLLTIAFLLPLSACFWDKKDKLYPASATGCDTTAAPTYSGLAKPILQSNCAISGCHDATASGGINLTTAAGAQAIARDGRLLNAINHAGNVSPMPKNGAKLNDCTILAISRWVTAGAQNN